MRPRNWMWSLAAVALVSGALSGCLPASQSQLDEEKEPHFLAGRARATEMDYKGAIAAFEKAAEVNPHSASAHFELACLLEKNESDPAAAIYHFQQYLRLRPAAENAEVVRQHILACKQELARTVSLGPVTEKQQREFEQLADENKRLHEEVEKWRAFYANGNRSPAPTNPPAVVQSTAHVNPTGAVTQAADSRSLASDPVPGARTSSQTATVAKTHTIKAGETPTVIAHKYGVKLEALMAANPHLDPRRLQPGQTLAIPAQ